MKTYSGSSWGLIGLISKKLIKSINFLKRNQDFGATQTKTSVEVLLNEFWQFFLNLIGKEDIIEPWNLFNKLVFFYLPRPFSLYSPFLYCQSIECDGTSKSCAKIRRSCFDCAITDNAHRPTKKLIRSIRGRKEGRRAGMQWRRLRKKKHIPLTAFTT